MNGIKNDINSVITSTSSSTESPWKYAYFSKVPDILTLPGKSFNVGDTYKYEFSLTISESIFSEGKTNRTIKIALPQDALNKKLKITSNIEQGNYSTDLFLNFVVICNVTVKTSITANGVYTATDTQIGNIVISKTSDTTSSSYASQIVSSGYITITTLCK